MATSLLTHPALQPVWTLLVVVLLERLWPWADKYHPLTFLRLLGQRLAAKVNPYGRAGAYQQKISGSLAILVLLAPVLPILWLFIDMAEFPAFFNGLLLLVALQYSNIRQQNIKLQSDLKQQRKSLARDRLQPMVLRQTSNLTELGLIKAGIETSVLRFAAQYCTVIFWYLLLGPLAALSYRMVYELHLSWNSKLDKFRHFGRPAAWLCGVCQWFPVRILVLTLALSENIGGVLKACRQAKPCNNRDLLLCAAAGALQRQLGGPVIYQGNKLRFAKVGANRTVDISDLKRINGALSRSLAIWLVLALLSATLFYAASIKL